MGTEGRRFESGLPDQFYPQLRKDNEFVGHVQVTSQSSDRRTACKSPLPPTDTARSRLPKFKSHQLKRRGNSGVTAPTPAHASMRTERAAPTGAAVAAFPIPPACFRACGIRLGFQQQPEIHRLSNRYLSVISVRTICCSVAYESEDLCRRHLAAAVGRLVGGRLEPA